MSDIGRLIGMLMQPRIFGPVIYAAALCLILRVTKAVYVKFKRRKTGYGIIFNSVTGKPIDLANIRLIDVHGAAAASAVTDALGHYRLTVSPGEYEVEISKTGFTFPSVFLKKRLVSKTYDNVLPSRRIKIKDHGIITKNIAVDPPEGTAGRSRVFRRGFVLDDNLQLIMAYASPFAALIYPLIQKTSAAAWSIFGVFTAVICYRLTNFLPGKPAYGVITDAETGEPVERAVARLFDAKFNKLLRTEVTSAKGRYAFLVNRGSYYMTLKKEGYRPVRLNFPHITKDSYPLATDVKMKPVASSQ
jgi:hypothetical protein